MMFGAEKQLRVITGKSGDEIGRWDSEKQPAEITAPGEKGVVPEPGELYCLKHCTV